MIMKCPDFKGSGLHSKMIPFLMKTIGRIDFFNLDVDQLQRLKETIQIEGFIQCMKDCRVK